MSRTHGQSGTAIRIAAAMVVFAAGYALVRADQLYLLGLVAALAAVFFLPVGDWFVVPFFAVLTGAAVLMNEHPLPVAGFQLYGADAVLLLMLSLPIVWYMKRERVRDSLADAEQHTVERRILTVYAGFFCWGLVALAVGTVLRGYPLNDALGTFRRLFFYSLALPMVLLMPLTRRHLQLLPAGVWTAFLLVAMTALYRLATGQTWQEQMFVIEATFPSPRLLSYTECIALAMALAYFVTLLRTTGRAIEKTFAIPAAALAMVLLLMSGWRLAAVYALVVPFLAMAGTSWRRRERLVWLIKIPAFSILLLAAGAVLAAYVFPGVFVAAYRQFMERATTFSPQDDMRYYIWQEALRQFASHPLVGAGLGHTLHFAARGSEGVFFMRESSTHNTLLTVLYQTGLPGMVLFAGLHLSFAANVLRNLRTTAEHNVAPLMGLFALYIGAFGFALLQPLPVGSIVALYMSMGLALHLVKHGERPAAVEEAGAQWE